MSDGSLDPPAPDPVVRTALRLLPVPDHEPSFWSDLSSALAAEPVPDPGPPPEPGREPEPAPARRSTRRVLVPAPEAVIELEPEPVDGVVPVAMRRRSNLVLSIAAVAAAVVVVVAGASLVRSRTGDQSASRADQGTATSAPAPAALEVPDDDPAAQAVEDWINALAAGDMAGAWDGLGPASQAHWGSEAAFAAERSAFAEGYGAWSAATPDQVIVTPLGAAGDGELVVVTLVGTLEQEGQVVARADAFPVRVTGDKAVVELYSAAGGVEVVVPEPLDEDGTRPPVDPGAELVVVVPEGIDPPVLRLDDGPPVVCGEAPGTRLTELDGTSGRRCGYSPEGGLPSGERVLTVAFKTPDGRAVAARSVRFRAA